MFDVEEYEKIVIRYSAPIYRYCYLKLNKNKELTEETVNDVFRVIYQKWESIERGVKIRAYLYRVADMCIKESIRKNSRYYKYNSSLEESVEKGEFDALKHYDDYFEIKDTDKTIYRISQELSEEYRELFFLRYIKKMTLTEISTHIGLPYSTLRLKLIKLETIVRTKIHNESEEYAK